MRGRACEEIQILRQENDRGQDAEEFFCRGPHIPHKKGPALAGTAFTHGFEDILFLCVAPNLGADAIVLLAPQNKLLFIPAEKGLPFRKHPDGFQDVGFPRAVSA